MANKALVLGFQSINHKRFINLSSIDNNCNLLYDLLSFKNEEGPLYDPLKPYIDLDAIKAQEAIINFCSSASPEDNILIAISGHGERVDGDGDDLLIPTPGMDDSNRHTQLRIREDLFRHVNNCIAQQKCILLDCCHSGVVNGLVETGQRNMRADVQEPGADAFVAQIAAKSRLGENVLILAASSANQAAFEGPAGPIWDALRRRIAQRDFFKKATYLNNQNQTFSTFIRILAQTVLFNDYLSPEDIRKLPKDDLHTQRIITILERSRSRLRGWDNGAIPLASLFEVTRECLAVGPVKQTPGLLPNPAAAETFPIFKRHFLSRQKRVEALHQRALGLKHASTKTKELLTGFTQALKDREYNQLNPSDMKLEDELCLAAEKKDADFVFVEAILNHQHSGLIAKELEAQKQILEGQRGTLQERLEEAIQENEDMRADFDGRLENLKAHMDGLFQKERSRLDAEILAIKQKMPQDHKDVREAILKEISESSAPIQRIINWHSIAIMIMFILLFCAMPIIIFSAR